MRSAGTRLTGAVVCLLLIGVQSLVAQPPLGSLTGTVVDRSGGVVGDALVEVTGSERSVRVRTARDGTYRVTALSPDDYRVAVSRAGFRPILYERIVVAPGEVVRLEVVLDVGSVAESVQVEGSGTQAGRVRFTQEQLESIPASRNAAVRLSSMPGVVVDRVDVGGNESHRQPEFVFRGSRMLDTAWTIDGVPFTDRQRGNPPGFYDSSSLEAITFAPASADITRPGSGLGVSMVVRSGTDEFRGSTRGSLTGHWLQASNVRDDLSAEPYFITSDTTDHTRQISDASADAGGPLLRSQAWFWGYVARRDVRLYRQASGDERTVLSPRTVKLNWQATSRDTLNGLWLDHGVARFGINPSQHRSTRDALQNESSLYADNPFHGLWKIEDRRVVSPVTVLSLRYAYYNTGTQALSAGSGQAGISPRLGLAHGATSSEWSLRPQHSVAADGTYFRRFARVGHSWKFGAGWQRVEMLNRTLWPGDGVVAFDNSPADMRARLYREAYGSNRLTFWSGYLSDTIDEGPWTVDLGLRMDHQRAETGASSVAGNPAFPNLLPGVEYGGGQHFASFDLAPRASVTFAWGSQRQTLLRASVGRYPSQLELAAAAQPNPTQVAGWIEYPWQDVNGDLLVQPGEVLVDLPLLAFSGVNPTDRSTPVPRAVIDRGARSRITTAISVSIERQFGQAVTGSLGYNYGRHTRWPANTWRGLTQDDYAVVRQVTEALPDGAVVTVPVYAPNPQKVFEHGSQRVFVDDHSYYTTYHGLEASLLKRLSGRWTLGATAALNNSRSFYGDAGPNGVPGNPTRLDGAGGPLSGPREPHVEGGQVAPATFSLSGGGVLFINARWQVSTFGTYRLPWDLDISGSLLGRQGAPSPYVVPQSLGLDGNRGVLMTPRVDTIRLDDLWNLDLRLEKRLRYRKATVQLTADVFNVLNGNAALMRERNLRSASFDRVTLNVSPRIVRTGLRVSF